jgi:hypothetical protein
MLCIGLQEPCAMISLPQTQGSRGNAEFATYDARAETLRLLHQVTRKLKAA